MHEIPRALEIFWPKSVTAFYTLIIFPLSHVILCVGVTKESKLEYKKGDAFGQKISKARGTYICK